MSLKGIDRGSNFLCFYEIQWNLPSSKCGSVKDLIYNEVAQMASIASNLDSLFLPLWETITRINSPAISLHFHYWMEQISLFQKLLCSHKGEWKASADWGLWWQWATFANITTPVTMKLPKGKVFMCKRVSQWSDLGPILGRVARPGSG